MRYTTPAQSLSELQDRADAYRRRKAFRKVLRKILLTIGITAGTVYLLEASRNDTYEVLGALALAVFSIYFLILVLSMGVKTLFGSMFGKGK